LSCLENGGFLVNKDNLEKAIDLRQVGLNPLSVENNKMIS
jgi:hypothetical protein